MIKDIWFKAEEIVSKLDVAEMVFKIFKTIIMFIACVGVFAVLLLSTLLKGRKRIIYNRDGTQEYLVRYYLFLKDREEIRYNSYLIIQIQHSTDNTSQEVVVVAVVVVVGDT